MSAVYTAVVMVPQVLRVRAKDQREAQRNVNMLLQDSSRGRVTLTSGDGKKDMEILPFLYLIHEGELL